MTQFTEKTLHYLDGTSSPHVINNTFVGNTVAIRNSKQLSNASHLYRNNILFNNTTGLKVETGSVPYTAAWDHNLVYNNTTNYSGIANQTGTNGNISVDPLLDPASAWPYRLLRDSPAIDAGGSTYCPDHDFLGAARPQGAFCDIGAFEGAFTFATFIQRIDPELTSAASVHYLVKFSEAVTGVELVAPFSDFALVSTGIAGAVITSVSGSGDTYTVTANTGTGSGSLRLDLVDDDSILDTTLVPIGGSGIGNADLHGQIYTIDKVSPDTLSITRADPDPVQGLSVDFNVNFSEPVTGLDGSDFSIFTTGSINNASVTSVFGSGSTYLVTVSTGTGLGSLRLDISTSAVVTDLAGNPLVGLPFQGGETYTLNTYYAFLPSLTKSKLANIYGYLYGNGLPMEGQGVELRLYDGNTTTTIQYIASESDGFFGFNNVPSLAPGQEYWARYINTSQNEAVVWYWCTRSLTSYSSGSSVFIGSFDIANIDLYAVPNTSTNLPYTFSWRPRPSTPTDSYELDLFDINDFNPYFFTPKLGYTGGYTLAHLPSGFATNTLYYWQIYAYSPDGGYGASYWTYPVMFLNRGSSLLPFISAGRIPSQTLHGRGDAPLK